LLIELINVKIDENNNKNIKKSVIMI